MESIEGASPRRLARMAGALYLMNIILGAFTICVVPAMLVVPVERWREQASTATRMRSTPMEAPV